MTHLKQQKSRGNTEHRCKKLMLDQKEGL